MGQTGSTRVVFATAELSPVATVGGLAAAAAGLGTELRRLGVDVDMLGTVVTRLTHQKGIELYRELAVNTS
ncbi:MAG TPA: glycogen/starch synthase [Ilumatobacteraceae bacterium]|nr:glycogen/starch synthase [Ilumatobacteraceae bacterium]